ncbi:serine/threonine-protein kinase [Actinomadura hibisca]|uniref:serine/threonine-protein kinase n=1 Tax=Actinomadura hibisca TaxID=68565 RepID=UPI00082E9E74|nr:serine/threonine-protein kinase [Actinomadura hibisca]
MDRWQVAGFEEVRELGRGAQGRVVLARRTTSGTPVAIKYLTGADEAARERFRHEAQLLGHVEHPHVARLYRLVESEHGLAIIMEAVNGVSLREILKRYEKIEPEAALTVLKGSLLGLAAAHTAQVVHRDYKPANVIVPADGNSKLIDFGVATPAGVASASGTALYMAPEQWRGEPATPATDVYAATCVFYECVTGRRPFGGDRAAIRAGHLTRPVPLDEMPEELRPLVERGMAKDPEERPAGAAAFVGELEQLAQRVYGADWEQRGVRALAGAAIAFAALFPLLAVASGGAASAAGTAAGGGAAGSVGLLSALGTKAGVAVAGAAVVGTTAGGVGVYEATKHEPPKRRPAAAVSSPAPPPGVPMTLGPLRLTVPKAWGKVVFPDSGPSAKYEKGPVFWVKAGGKCGAKPDPESFGEVDRVFSCPGFQVLGESYINPPRELTRESYNRTGPFHPGTDITHLCPPAPDKYQALKPIATPQNPTAHKPTVQKLAPVGSKKAEYFEWKLTCWNFSGKNRNNPSFRQRIWYLPESKILIVDEWDVPGLPEILARAVWI